MTSLDIVRQRLYNQHLVGVPFEKPSDVVGWLGAVQAQEYAGAKWAIAQRTQGITDAALEQAFAEGAILRTHIMRPTWHFVTPADIRWMLELTAPRVSALNAHYYRKLELDDSLFVQSHALLAKALQGGQQLTRPELASVLEQSGITTGTHDRLRLAYIMMRAELDAVICSGALRGKQHTYALLDERVPQAKTLERDEALAELAKRYFTSHGPATLKDFSWWSGLSASEARAGLEMVKPQFAQEVVDGKTYWFAPNVPTPQAASPTAHLLPAYDEYTIAYKDHSAVLDPQYLEQVISAYGIVIVIEGHIAGTWKRTFKKGTVTITPSLFTPLGQAEDHALAEAAQRYGAFLEMAVTFDLQNLK